MGGTRILVAVGILGISSWGALELLRRAGDRQLGSQADRPPPSVASPVEPDVEASRLVLDGGAPEGAPWIDVHELSDALCPAGMAWIGGEYCPKGGEGKFGCKVSVRSMGFCMDRHEYPNQPRVLPAVMLHFNESRRLCQAEGKRLCLESEWTHACRGTVSPTSCNFGRRTKEVPVGKLREASEVSAAVASQDARRPSGVSACVSPGGVFDLPGNVQEWTLSEHPSGYQAALKGGRYNESQIDCERSIQSLQVYGRLPHTGLRCCRDPLVRVPDGQ